MILDKLKAYLDAMGATSLLWPCYEGYLPDTMDQVIAVFETGGYPPDTLERDTETITIQLRVRGAKLDYAVVRAKWLECFNLLEDANAMVSPSLLTGVVFIQAMQFGANCFFDENGRPNFITNFRVYQYR